MSKTISRDEAWELLTEYNKEEFHLKHARVVESVMRFFAEESGYAEEADLWALVGLLHDLDFEMFPDEHCIKTQEILRELELDERLIRAIASHGYAFTVDIKPEHHMEKILFAVDELTGLIGAAVRMRPSKSALDLEVKSLRKKFKDKSFAAGCSREVITRGAEMLGWELDELFEKTILAMRYAEEQGV
ncbi:MAG: HD domain-containing protein [Coriobacteriia bacterium]|nr:HD domain-containing protein [Coriobacteriia bacterium]MCL2750431.1 HD domain-containing protein [Coriobacteriia bacterium]